MITSKISLKETFPRLYTLSKCKETTITEAESLQNNVWNWELEWRRTLFQWELEQIQMLVDNLSTNILRIDKEDKLKERKNFSDIHS